MTVPSAPLINDGDDYLSQPQRVLDVLWEADKPLFSREISKKTGLDISNVSYCIKRLEKDFPIKYKAFIDNATDRLNRRIPKKAYYLDYEEND